MSNNEGFTLGQDARPDLRVAQTNVGRVESPDLSPMDVREQLERILASPDFAVSERDRKLLRYVVEEALAGRAERIKAYSIATEVFGRDAAFAIAPNAFDPCLRPPVPANAHCSR